MVTIGTYTYLTIIKLDAHVCKNNLDFIPHQFSGRVHLAIVSTINHEQQSATVEWYEQGETKGKEIDLVAIEALNPEVIIVKPGERYIQPPSTLNQTSQNKLQRVINTFF